MSENSKITRAPKCKHPFVDHNLRCKTCGCKVDIRAKHNKYGNRKVVCDGIKFDSLKESRRWTDLRNDCNVAFTARQVEYPLTVNGVLVCSYVADFVYDRDGKEVVEDVKPRSKAFKKTAAYRMFEIKKRLMKAIHGVDVVEV